MTGTRKTSVKYVEKYVYVKKTGESRIFTKTFYNAKYQTLRKGVKKDKRFSK